MIDQIKDVLTNADYYETAVYLGCSALVIVIVVAIGWIVYKLDQKFTHGQ